MTEEQFWTVVEDAHRRAGGNVAAQARSLVTVLAEGPLDDVVAFSQWFQHLVKRAGTPRLLAAHYLIQDGSHSDDGFQYFRAWLVGQGRPVFEAAVADPDSLAERLPYPVNPIDQTGGEPLLYVATRAASAKLGEDAFEEDDALLDAMHSTPPGVSTSDSPRDAPVVDADAATRLPRLAARLEELWSRAPERPRNVVAEPRPDGSTAYYHPT